MNTPDELNIWYAIQIWRKAEGRWCFFLWFPTEEEAELITDDYPEGLIRIVKCEVTHS